MSNPTELPNVDFLQMPDLRFHAEYRRGYAAAKSDLLLELARRAQPEGEAPQAEPEPDPSLEDCPEDDQHWAKVDPAVAFHLIERHAEDWADAGRMMLQWHKAMSRAAQLDGGQGEKP